MTQPAADPARRARRDLWWVLLLPLACYLVSAWLDLRESISVWLARHEGWDADELPHTLLVLALALAWYAFRRRHEARQALALQAQAEAQARELLARNRQLTQSLLTLQEEERRAIARDLHDEMGQQCTALRMETAFLRACRPDDRSAWLAATGRADAAASAIYQVVRGLLARLRPVPVESAGLAVALQELCDGWSARSGVRCEFSSSGEEPALDETLTMTAFRVAQEALNNVMRHAGARNVQVSLRFDRTQGLLLEVADDGVGFGPQQPRRGLGLLGAAERAAACGGRFEISSQPGAGTRLRLQLALHAAPGADDAAAGDHAQATAEALSGRSVAAPASAQLPAQQPAQQPAQPAAAAEPAPARVNLPTAWSQALPHR